MRRYSRDAIILGIQIFIAFILLLGCFEEEELAYTYTGEDLMLMGKYEEGSSALRTEYMSLEQGVYQIRVWSVTGENQEMSVELCCDGEAYGSLKTNAVTVFSNDEYIDFEVYLSYKIQSAYLDFHFSNMNALNIQRVDVVKTNMGNRIALFCTLLLWVVLDGLVIIRRKILAGKITKEQQIVFWSLTGCVLVAFYPYMTDYYYIGADTLFHWGRVAFLKDTLLHGVDLPIRVHDTWLYDHGYAVPMFYGDLMITIPAVLMLIGFSLMTAYKCFVLVVIIMTAYISYYSLRKCTKSAYAALFGSMIYLLSPYYIFNIYSRSAVGEMTAMAFLPLIFCGVYLLYTEDICSEEYKKYKWYIILGMTGALQCHIISTELTVMLMGSICLCFWKKTFRKQTFLQLAEAVGIVLVINAWFWVPLIYMMGNESLYLRSLPQSEIQERGLLFASFFQMLPNKGSAQIGMYQCEPVHVGAGSIMLLILYPLWKFRKREKNGTISCFAVLCGITLLMSTMYFPWNIIQKVPVIGFMVSSLQFSSRWMIWAIVLASIFSAFFCKKIIEKGSPLMKMAIGCAILITIMTAVYHVNSIVANYGAIYLYEEENMGTHSVGNGEYVVEEALVSEIHFHDPIAETGVEWSDYRKEGTEIRIHLKNTTEEEHYIEFPLMGYQGYSIAIVEGMEGPYITDELGKHGDLRIAVPGSYEGSIYISYTGFPMFRVAEVISMVGILVIMILALYRQIKRRRNER